MPINDTYLTLIPCNDIEKVKYFYTNILDFDYSSYIKDVYLEYKINDMSLVFCESTKLLNTTSSFKNKVKDLPKKELLIKADEKRFLDLTKKLDKYTFIDKKYSNKEDMHSIELKDPEGNSILLYFSHERVKSLSKSNFV